MLTDEEIETAMSGKELPMDYYELKQFARDIERAVLAKALAQQERLHKEWSELWSPIDEAVRPLTPLGESVAAKALELINTAKAMQKQEPVAVMGNNGRVQAKCEFADVDSFLKCCRNNTPLYAAPQPAQAAAMPEKLQDIEIPKAPTNGENPYIWITQQEYVRGWNDCREAMLSASPKPE